MRPQPHPRDAGRTRPDPDPLDGTDTDGPPADAASARGVAASMGDDVPELPGRRPRPTPGFRSTFATFSQPDFRPGYFDRPIDEQDAEDDERRGLVARLSAMPATLRSNPRTVQRGSLSVIAAGVVLFVAASLATPLASAETKNPTPVAKRELRAAAAKLHTAAPLTVVPAAPQVLQRKPAHATTQAPVDHGTISGLAANGIPKVALNAYRVAAARMRHVDPGCGIDWALLAGIGREESNHGRFGGAQLHADGTSTPRIIGPALDGKHWDYIPAPGNGIALAGDARYAHALGPMQFIPSTWATYGTDANGDGKADIFNINDAALGAARYLCAAGGDLRTHAGQVRAVLAYNHSDQYLAQVLALAEAYRTGVTVTGIPVGNTTGALPKVADNGYIPPVNPAPPTAVSKDAKDKAAKAAKAKAAKEKAAKDKAARDKAAKNGESSKHPVPTSSSKSTKPSGNGGSDNGGSGHSSPGTGGSGGGHSSPAGGGSSTSAPPVPIPPVLTSSSASGGSGPLCQVLGEIVNCP